MVVVNPYAPFMPSAVIGNANTFIPWLSTSTSTVNQPYAGATISTGPFNASLANYISQYTDISNLSF